MDATPPAPPLPRQAAMQAAEWFVRLHGGDAKPAEQGEFDAWLAASPDHARAWQRALKVNGQATGLPGALASSVLRRPRGDRRKAVRTLALLITTAPAGWLAWQAMSWPRWQADYATATGEQRNVRLADGSSLTLDTASTVDVAFDAQWRILRLHAGAILVATTPDPQTPPRPFIVQTAEGRVRAIGTRFTVRQEEGRSHVAVLEGAVELTPREGGPTHTIKAGQQASFTTRLVGPTQPTTAQAGQWARGVLAVEDMRLADFAAELSRYRPGLLQCDPAVADLRITGAFQLDDTDNALRNVARLLPIQLRYRTRYWVALIPT